MSNNSPKQWFKLEEQFFSGVDQQLLSKLQEQHAIAETAEAIMKVTGITDQALANELASVGITTQTLTAFRLLPLVAVAWADDRMEENERYTILQAAEKSGIGPDEPAMELLKVWTTKRPPSELYDAWCDYTKALVASINGELREVLKKEILEQMEAVAKSAGGLLGFGSISPSEKSMIECIKKTLS